MFVLYGMCSVYASRQYLDITILQHLQGMKGYFKSAWPNTEHGFYWTSDFDLSIEYNIMYVCNLSMKS